MAISDVQLKGSWYAVFDGNGKNMKDIAASSVGELCGFGIDFPNNRHSHLLEGKVILS